ncbi:MAG: site-specific integrase [Lachnospiraceae bacterium]|nr:site-specific integrase [Lachnospiraceae bacterium]
MQKWQKKGKILKASEMLDTKHRLWVELYVMSGCRRGEIVGLKWNRVCFDQSCIFIDLEVVYTGEYGIQLSSPKSKAGERMIVLPKSTMELLKRYYDDYVKKLCIDESTWDRNDFLFFQTEKLPEIFPMNPTSLTHYFSEFSKKYALPHLNPHALRHSYASVLIQSNELSDLELAKTLGHSSPSVTEEIYGHLFKDPSSKAASVVTGAYKKE